MTTDTIPATAVNRPPHIDPQWWYRATWHARQQAVAEHNRSNRPAPTPDPEPELIADYTLDTEAIVESITLWITDLSPELIANRLDTTVGALEQRLRRAGFTELARPFLQARKRANVHPCPDCGTPIGEGSKRCHPCAMREFNSRPEVRTRRSMHAKGGKFGKGAAA